MKKMLFSSLSVLATALIIVMVSGMASAQTADVFWTNYFSNNNCTGNYCAGAPDATVRITNPGVVAGNKGTFNAPGPGSLCAMIYVHSSDQQMNECCGCLVTPNGLQTISVHKELTFNPLTFRTPNTGVIQIISAAPNSNASATAVDPAHHNSSVCDPSAVYTPTPDLRAWVTHIQNAVPRTGPGQANNSNPITETESLEAPLSASELGWEEGACNFAVIQGSGQGVCDCGKFEGPGY